MSARTPAFFFEIPKSLSPPPMSCRLRLPLLIDPHLIQNITPIIHVVLPSKQHPKSVQGEADFKGLKVCKSIKLLTMLCLRL